MELAIVTSTVQWFQQKELSLTEEDKEFVIRFAFRTQDLGLTHELMEELCQPNKDSHSIYENYNSIVDFQPEWIQKIENLLVALEIYRVQEEGILQSFQRLHTAYGTFVPEGSNIPRADGVHEKEKLGHKPKSDKYLEGISI